MMVPIFYDVQGKQMKVWAVLGWPPRSCGSPLPSPQISRQRSTSAGRSWSPGRLTTRPLSTDWRTSSRGKVDVHRLLDRREFREHCDRYKTAEAILSNLK